MRRIPGINYNEIEIGTHLPVLVRAFVFSEGDVLELGSGIFSTPLLKWLCEMSGRTLYTYEHKPEWYEKAKKKSGEFHKVIKVTDWDQIDIASKHWGLAFIDHDPTGRRHIDTAQLADHADYIVIHDTDEDKERKYKYGKIWHLFKYVYHFRKYKPNTSVVSNFKSLKGFE